MTQLTLIPQPTSATVMMTSDEARATVAQIRAHFDGARGLLLDLHEREGWRALGYTNWRSCAMKEFGTSQSHLYRQLTAAQVERDIDSPIGEIRESVLRPLSDLESAQERRDVWHQAQASAPSGKVTAAHVAATVTQHQQRGQVKATAPQMPPDFERYQSRAVVLGWALSFDGLYVINREGPPIITASWEGMRTAIDNEHRAVSARMRAQVERAQVEQEHNPIDAAIQALQHLKHTMRDHHMHNTAAVEDAIIALWTASGREDMITMWIKVGYALLNMNESHYG